MELTSKVVESFPALVRGGSSKNAEERAWLKGLLENGEINEITPIKTDQQFNATQQRIRGLAKQMGIAVKIHRDKINEALVFNGYERVAKVDPKEVAVKA